MKDENDKDCIINVDQYVSLQPKQLERFDFFF